MTEKIRFKEFCQLESSVHIVINRFLNLFKGIEPQGRQQNLVEPQKDGVPVSSDCKVYLILKSFLIKS